MAQQSCPALPEFVKVTCAFPEINSEYLANRAARVPQAGARIGEHQRDRSENNKEQNHCNDNVVDPIL